MLNDDYIMRKEDLVNNPTTRLPVCFCLDVSGSMSGEPIEELNRGVREFYQAIKDDEMALYSAEVCIVTFGGNDAVVLQDFASLTLSPQPPVLRAEGGTPMGEAVNKALDLLEQRKQEYKDVGVDYYQPWLVLMTDGYPNGSKAELERSIGRTVDLINTKKLTIFPISIGDEADMNILARYSPKWSVLKLQGLKFREFFQWLSKSVSKTSVSSPGEKIDLDFEGIKGWAEI